MKELRKAGQNPGVIPTLINVSTSDMTSDMITEIQRLNSTSYRRFEIFISPPCWLGFGVTEGRRSAPRRLAP